ILIVSINFLLCDRRLATLRLCHGPALGVAEIFNGSWLRQIAQPLHHCLHAKYFLSLSFSLSLSCSISFSLSLCLSRSRSLFLSLLLSVSLFLPLLLSFSLSCSLSSSVSVGQGRIESP